MTCSLLPSFPTYKQNRVIHQHGTNCTQSYDVSTHMLGQLVRNCLCSLCTPHVWGTSTLPTGHRHAQPGNQEEKWLPAWRAVHTPVSALRPAFTLLCKGGGFKASIPQGIWLYTELWTMLQFFHPGKEIENSRNFDSATKFKIWHIFLPHIYFLS